MQDFPSTTPPPRGCHTSPDSPTRCAIPNAPPQTHNGADPAGPAFFAERGGVEVPEDGTDFDFVDGSHVDAGGDRTFARRASKESEENSERVAPVGNGAGLGISPFQRSNTLAPASFTLPAREPAEWHLRAGARRLAAVTTARELLGQDMPWPLVSAAVGVPLATLYRWVKSVSGKTAPTAEDLANRTFANGKPPQIARLNPAEAAEVKALYLRTNRTNQDGSIVEAFLQAIERGVLRPEIVQLVKGRLAAGLPPIARSQLHLLRTGKPTVTASRSPRGAWLRYINSPGALQLDVNPETGEEEHIAAGSRWTIDDGSINLLVTVPGLEIPGDPCWEAYGVVIGRFQLLLTVDHRTRCIIGRGFTCRPKDAYRAEDLTSALHRCVSVHGAPREIVLEKGISAASLVTNTLESLGVKIIRADSPHQKVVESVFNVLWTALSTLPGQIGRTRGEMEKMHKWHMAAREGRRDPRKELMSLPDFLRELDAAIDRCNARMVEGRQGRWRPIEWWNRRPSGATRRIAAEDLWMFVPCVTDPLKVNFNQVATSVPMVAGRSERFVFSAPWLADWHGARVKLHFDPWAENCEATAVLAVPVGQHKAGKLLGKLEQIDRLTRFTRRALCLSAEGDIGRQVTAAASRQLVADVKAIGAPASAPKPECPADPVLPHRPQRTRPPAVGRNDRSRADSAPVTPPAWSDPRLQEFTDP